MAKVFDLKRCPFCSGKATLAHVVNWWVECEKYSCQSSGPKRKTRSSAVKAWNNATARTILKYTKGSEYGTKTRKDEE